MKIKEVTKAVMRLLAAHRQAKPSKFALMMWDSYEDYEADCMQVYSLLEWANDELKPSLEERARSQRDPDTTE